jgi:hypothetical protein
VGVGRVNGEDEGRTVGSMYFGYMFEYRAMKPVETVLKNGAKMRRMMQRVKSN